MNVIITAPRGKMGKLLVRMATEREGLDIVAGLGPKGRSYIGQDIGIAADLGYPVNIPVVDDLEQVIERCDLIIDFSTVELSMEVLKSAIRHQKAVLCGTTGFDAEQLMEIRAAARKIPVLKAANTSYVVHVMNELLGFAARALKGKTDIDIIDFHDRMKKDSPSGTAIELAETMTKAMGRAPDEDFLSFHSVRSGDIASSHQVIFGCLGEQLEIMHRAQNWECFARGAIDAAFFMDGKGPGFYTMGDVIRSSMDEEEAFGLNK